MKKTTYVLLGTIALAFLATIIGTIIFVKLFFIPA